MVNSMTGYGRSEGYDGGVFYRVEIRSLNHRFQEVTVRMPRELFLLEEAVKKEVQQRFYRGRIDVFVTLESDATVTRQADIDWELAARVVKSARALQERFALAGELSVTDLMHVPDILTVREAEVNVEGWREALIHHVRQACTALQEMRATEGVELAKDIRKRIERIATAVQTMWAHAPLVVESYRRRMGERLQQSLREVQLDEARLLTEAAVFAEKCAIDEELTRLDSHCKHALQLLSSTEPIGRKCDFLVQEMNREINTIGSKANALAISQIVVDVKSELEKIREQVQNIE
ncbi:YicC/YloC family endoribonuclease [Numidum massiliense]|uniref:YicC/YloC family endoribonuclease n=1 Tax=Numidum massiliense TaxID=1522315 RepID=UPI00093AC6FD|nr:YicC/YloC family endoribonuclease [Numidum massiliense]